MEHHNLTNEQHVGTKLLRAEKLAFHTHLCLRHARRLDVHRGRHLQLCRFEFTLIRRKIGRREVHGVKQVLGNHIHHELAAGLNVLLRILELALVVASDADNQVHRIAAKRIEETERRQIDHPALAERADPGNRARYDQVG